MRLWALMSMVWVGACAPSPPVWGGRHPVTEARAVYEVAVRWFAANYQPSSDTPNPAALCLVVGLRYRTALELSRRDERWDPARELLARLDDAPLRVVPISRCEWGAALEEVLVDGGFKAISLGLSEPRWITPDLAELNATIHEHHRERHAYRCSLKRGPEGWEIRRCI